MALNRTQIIDLVLGRLGRREGDTYMVAQAKTELALVQSRLESAPTLPWFLLSGETTVGTTTADVRYVTLPANFIMEWDYSKLAIYDATATDPYTELEKDDYDSLLVAYGETASGEPEAYALTGSQYDLFPVPDDVYTLKQNYYKRAEVLTDVVLTNVWTENADDLLVAELGLIMARYARNETAKADFAADIALAQKRIKHVSIARDQANKEIYRGGKTD